MNFLAVVLNVGTLDYADLALAAQRKYYKHFGIPFEVCTARFSEMANTSPSWQRMVIHEMYDADFILVHGLDMLPCNLNYDIRDFLLLSRINLATDCSMLGRNPYEVPDRPFRYNADMIGYPKSCAPWFRSIWDTYKNDPAYKDTFEQYCMNIELYKQGVYVNEIPNLFNRFFHPEMDYAHTAYCHYTNYMASREKRKYIEQYHPKGMIL